MCCNLRSEFWKQNDFKWWFLLWFFAYWCLRKKGDKIKWEVIITWRYTFEILKCSFWFANELIKSDVWPLEADDLPAWSVCSGVGQSGLEDWQDIISCGSLALPLGLRTQSLALPYLGFAAPKEKPLALWNPEFSDPNFLEMTLNQNLLMPTTGCFHLRKIFAALIVGMSSVNRIYTLRPLQI